MPGKYSQHTDALDKLDYGQTYRIDITEVPNWYALRNSIGIHVRKHGYRTLAMRFWRNGRHYIELTKHPLNDPDWEDAVLAHLRRPKASQDE